MQNLIGLSKEDLTQELVENMGEKPFRARQLWHSIYNRGEKSFADMTVLSKEFRAKLAEKYTVDRPAIVTELNSEDRTRKWLLEMNDGKRVESVYIPEEDRGAVCVSTQVGCAVGCKFCHTGSQKIERNLTSGEIVSQFMVARDSYGEWPSPVNETRMLSNIVVMGMGEPFNNYDNTIKAMKIIMDGDGLAISKRRITVSTSGIVPNIIKAADDLGTKLAISLHAPNNEIREKIMPITKKYPIEEIIGACKEYQKKISHYITMEYIMLDGINDAPEHANELISLVRGMGVKFNLIPFNAWPGSEFKSSSMNKIRAFAAMLEKAGYAAPVRVSRGQDIMAACGQLKAKVNKEG